VRVRWVLGITIVLLFMAEAMSPYGKYWIAPFEWVQQTIFEALPWKIRPFDHIVAGCLFFALRSPDGKGPRVKPMHNALLLSGASLVIWFVYGVLQGGGSWQASWQTYLPMSGVLFAFAVAAAFRTPEHYALLAKMLFVAAGYRAFMCWCFYFMYVRTLAIMPLPEYITSHDDTVLWVVCVQILVLHMLETPSSTSRRKAFAFFVFLMGAVLFNQRRIAWVSLAMGLVLMYVLLPPGRSKRRATYAAYCIIPVVLLYVAVGWGRPEKIFRPLQAFSTVSTEEDTSTKARNMENLGLVATSMKGGLLMGTGWGQPYVEVSNRYSIATVFKMWAYFPHNSVLGMLGYTGVLGFFAYWLAFPTAMYLSARMARQANHPLARQAGIIGAVQLVACANQYYGDMGITYPRSVYMLAMSYAIALRLPVMTGAWPAPKPPVAKDTTERQPAPRTSTVQA
jgi:hypothetical protein